MGAYDFTYQLPNNFNNRVIQFLQQKGRNDLLIAFQQCTFEYENLGNAYYNGIRGDNWDMNAIDVTIEGSSSNIKLLNANKQILDDVIDKALQSRKSGLQLKNIYCLVSDGNDEFISQSNEERLNCDISVANSVLQDLIRIGECVCTSVEYNKSTKENIINDFFRNGLSLIGYHENKDQIRHGISSSGKDAGEVDILLTKEGKEIALFEGLKLDCVSTKYINEHIDKAINNYNALGTATFVVAYVNTSDFSDFWRKYLLHLKECDLKIKVKKEIQECTHPNASIRIANAIFSRDDYDFPAYFICLKIE